MEKEYKGTTYSLTKPVGPISGCDGCVFEKSNIGCMSIGDDCMTDEYEGKCWEEKKEEIILVNI